MENDEQTEIKITYETIFELLRREKNRGELQKLNISFYNDIVIYLKEKEIGISVNTLDTDFNHKAFAQLNNIKRMIKELFERREKKIIIMSLNKARSSQSIIDRETLLPSEEGFFTEMLKIFQGHRVNILNKILKKENIVNPINNQKASIPSIPKPQISQQQTQDSTQTEPVNVESNLVKIKFLLQMPKFMGKNMQNYGPYNVGDVAELPSDVSDILIKKQRASLFTE